VNENESRDSKQGTSDSPVESKHQDMQEELQSSELQEEALQIPETDLVSCDQKPEVEGEGLIEEDVPEHLVSDSPKHQEGVLESDNIEQCNRYDEDAKKDGVSENESHDSKQGTSESPVESAHQEMEQELRSSELQEEVSSVLGNELVAGDQKPEVESEGSMKEDMPEQVASDNNDNKCDEDAKKDLNENESHDPRQGMSESPVKSEYDTTKLE
jgi:hypothetical protein